MVNSCSDVCKFTALNLDVYPIGSQSRTGTGLHRLTRKGCNVVCVARTITTRVPSRVGGCNRRAFPTVVRVPNISKGAKTKIRNIGGAIRRTIKSSVLFKKMDR